VLRYIQKEFGSKEGIPVESIPDIAASFQKAAVDALVQKSEKALKKYKVNSISVVGGVAANKYLRNRFADLSKKHKTGLIIPDLQFCGDNAAMIALRGSQLFNNGQRFDLSYNAFASLPETAFFQ
jgi:N6-L-threonylcarbamoyladenine synthase